MSISVQLKQSLGELRDLHHAHVIVGPKDEVRRSLHECIEMGYGITIAGNPDVLSLSFDVLGVDESRFLSSASVIASIDGHRFIVVEANFLTREAQNALLKILEEPIAGVYFFFIVPQIDTILSTIRSRVMIHALSAFDDGVHESRVRAEAFIEASLAKRLLMIKEWVAEISDGEKSRADSIVFLAELERIVCSRKVVGDQLSLLADIAVMKRYLADRSPSVKMILEHIALSL